MKKQQTILVVIAIIARYGSIGYCNDFPVKPGDAILTRGGSSHGLVQTGAGDLTIIITFQK